MHSRQLSIVNPRATALEPRTSRPCILLGGETFQAATLLKLTGGLRRIDFYVSEEEYSKLCELRGACTVEILLESLMMFSEQRIHVVSKLIF